MNIESAEYGKDYNNVNCCIVAIINGEKCLIPLDTDNRHYQAIQEWVAKGNTITDNGGGE